MSSSTSTTARKRPASPVVETSKKQAKVSSFFLPNSQKAKVGQGESFWVTGGPSSLLHYSHLRHLVPLLPPVVSKRDIRETLGGLDTSVVPDSAAAAAVDDAPSGARAKVAFFDLDGTLILTASGSKFPRDGSDWKFWSSAVPGQLKTLHESGWRIAIISNQNGLPVAKSGAQKKRDQWKIKIEAIARKFPETPFEVLAALDKDHYRKPLLGMWDQYAEAVLPKGVGVDLVESYYVGDAAGRTKDHGDGDRKWAANAGLAFFTPEMYFSKQKETLPPLQGFRPVNLDSQPFFSPSSTPLLPSSICFEELIILVGPPGSGKSLFCRQSLLPQGYERINQDELGSRPKCLARAREVLERSTAKEGQPPRRIVVDNTNRDRATRKVWIDLAREFELPVRIFVFSPTQTLLALAKHNNIYRLYPSVTGTCVPPLAIGSFVRDFEEVDGPVELQGVIGGEVKRLWMGAWRGSEDCERARWEGWMS